MSGTNMYEHSVEQWNVCVGCLFDCVYCRKSYQAQMKRQRWNCQYLGENGESKCYTYEPHFHYERLWDYLSLTKEKHEFIWACSAGDISFADPLWIDIILSRIKKRLMNRTFLFQSKDPRCFKEHEFPENVMLGITLETNRDEGYSEGMPLEGMNELISKAPSPSARNEAFLDVEHGRKIYTIEPILDFDLEELVGMIKEGEPERVYLGYDTKNCGLPEPDIKKTKKLRDELRGFTKVFLKHVKT